MKNQSISSNIDWVIVTLYSVLVILGWLNIYSSSSPVEATSLFDMNHEYGKQLLFIIITIPLIFVVLSVDAKFYEKFSSIIYAASLVAVAGLFVFGKEIKGQTNWYSFGSFSLQPAEFAKAATGLALAKYLGDVQINLNDVRKQIIGLGIIFLPILLIIPNDPGSALIFMSLTFVLYREGLPAWYLWVGLISIVLFVMSLLLEPVYIVLISLVVITLIYLRTRLVNRNIVFSAIILVLISAFTFSVSYVFDNVFQDHHRDRFNVLLGKKVDDKGIGYNINQSKIAIGSGGLIAKNYF